TAEAVEHPENIDHVFGPIKTPRSPRALRLLFTPRRLLPAVTHAPDRVRAVVADEQRAVGRHRHADGAAPHVAGVDDAAGEEVFVFTGRRAVPERDTDHCVGFGPGGWNAMPNGRRNPSAKTSVVCARPALSRPRSTLMRPGPLSATKMSPFGAVRIKRGLSSASAYNARV